MSAPSPAPTTTTHRNSADADYILAAIFITLACCGIFYYFYPSLLLQVYILGLRSMKVDGTSRDLAPSVRFSCSAAYFVVHLLIGRILVFLSEFLWMVIDALYEPDELITPYHPNTKVLFAALWPVITLPSIAIGVPGILFGVVFKILF